MSLRTRIHGLTAWVNLRLKPYSELMNNVLMDLLKGTNLRLLLKSMTGVEMSRLESFDNLTKSQKITRVEWVVDQLKKSRVIPDDVYVDSRLFAMRSANHVFELLWRLVSHDIWFVWERLGYLQQDDDQLLSEVPFKWVPEPPPMKNKTVTYKPSLLSGFGASALIAEDNTEQEVDEESSYEPFPKSKIMTEFKPRHLKNGRYPAPEDCILEMINIQLKCVADTKKVFCTKLSDLSDSHVLCTLVNSFVPHTFTTEVLPNDRWTINLILKTIEQMFHMHSSFEAEDILEGDTMSMCAYFGAFFMVAYKYRQTYSVVSWLDHLRLSKKQAEDMLEELSSAASDPEVQEKRAELQEKSEIVQQAISDLASKFDVAFCSKWLEHVGLTVVQTHIKIREKFKSRFETFILPRSLSVQNLCEVHGINLLYTNGAGFLLTNGDSKELLNDNRKLVIWDKQNKIFIDNFSNKCRDALLVRKLLGLPASSVVIVQPSSFPQYQLFFEVISRNKILKAGSTFLYQVFPSHTIGWQKLLQRAVRENEVETVQRLMVFFQSNLDLVNCRDPATGNTPLHWACKLGRYDIALQLLESGANLDSKNSFGSTPLICATDHFYRDIAHLLIEWGCDVHIRGPKGMTAFESIKTHDLRTFLVGVYDNYCSWVPRLVNGDMNLMEQLLRRHAQTKAVFNNLRSRCVNGSTLLHTAAYFGSTTNINLLLALGVSLNLKDHKGASALHRARDIKTMQLLVVGGASPAAMDNDYNSVLHVKCYGDLTAPTSLNIIKLLLNNGAKLTTRNSQMLMPIHCAAMRGRADIIKLLMETDPQGEIQRTLVEEENTTKPPSVVYLAIVSDFLPCAQWLVENGFNLKKDEAENLLQKILRESIKVSPREDAVKFVLQQGAQVNTVYSGGNTPLHCAACVSGSTDVLQLLLKEGAVVDAVNDDGCTPLFLACQINHQHAGFMLIASGANIKHKNVHGLTALDMIPDYDDWINSGFFDNDFVVRLRAYSLKNMRDLVQAISSKVQSRTKNASRPAAHITTTTSSPSLDMKPLRGGSNINFVDDAFSLPFQH